MPFEPSSKDEPEPIHKWERCDQCRHPEHPSACEVCRCLAVTSGGQNAERCRSAGGCPKHPRPKPAEAGCAVLHQDAQGNAIPCPDEAPAATDLPPPEGPEYTPCVSCGHIEPEHREASCWQCNECTAYRPVCQHGEELVAECPCTPLCGCCPSLPAPPPPQPAPRPPYAIAYSVEGQLYEASLPGDATVVAMDGVLIIEHHGRAVSGITQVLPMRQEK